MPNLASAKKRLRQNFKRKARNRVRKVRFRRAQKQFLALLEENNIEAAREELARCYSALDKAAKRGVFHKNKADRKKQRLYARLRAAEAAAAAKSAD